MKTIIMSLGGSVIVPNRIDVNFLMNFKKIIYRYIKKNYRFVIYCGGGKLARNFQKSAAKYKFNNEGLDWLGIYATRINADFIKKLFGNIAEDIIIKNPTKKIKFNKKIILAGGWKPGWSTDYDAVLLAKNLKVKTIINMSNINYVYDKDPKKFKGAKKIKNISWREFRKITGNKWKAGLNMPFDPVAAKEADKLRLKVVIIGNNLRNFENLLNDRKFEGTIIT
ncbi:MAG: UMP kinase [Candidatus Woesearchaeota archaeon]|nr:UMP kinase [Candidatus Woesearchaeota archaeon]